MGFCVAAVQHIPKETAWHEDKNAHQQHIAEANGLILKATILQRKAKKRSGIDCNNSDQLDWASLSLNEKMDHFIRA